MPTSLSFCSLLQVSWACLEHCTSCQAVQLLGSHRCVIAEPVDPHRLVTHRSWCREHASSTVPSPAGFPAREGRCQQKRGLVLRLLLLFAGVR